MRAFTQADDGVRRDTGADSGGAYVGIAGVNVFAGSGALRIDGGKKLRGITGAGEAGNGYAGKSGSAR
jgi:hypothetical protein